MKKLLTLLILSIAITVVHATEPGIAGCMQEFTAIGHSASFAQSQCKGSSGIGGCMKAFTAEGYKAKYAQSLCKN